MAETFRSEADADFSNSTFKLSLACFELLRFSAKAFIHLFNALIIRALLTDFLSKCFTKPNKILASRYKCHIPLSNNPNSNFSTFASNHP